MGEENPLKRNDAKTENWFYVSRVLASVQILNANYELEIALIVTKRNIEMWRGEKSIVYERKRISWEVLVRFDFVVFHIGKDARESINVDDVRINDSTQPTRDEFDRNWILLLNLFFTRRQ